MPANSFPVNRDLSQLLKAALKSGETLQSLTSRQSAEMVSYIRTCVLRLEHAI
jgi:hypothetical protein